MSQFVCVYYARAFLCVCVFVCTSVFHLHVCVGIFMPACVFTFVNCVSSSLESVSIRVHIGEETSS